MHIQQTGGDGAGFVTPLANGPIRQLRRPFSVIAVTTAFLMLFGGFAFLPGAAGAQAQGSQLVTVDHLNFRTGPSLAADIIDVIPAGTTVEAVGETGTGYVEVIYGDRAGFAHGDWLVSPDAVSEPAAPVVTTTGNSIVDIIYAAAAKYGQSGDDLLRVAQCESGLNPGAVNGSSNASGLFQFLPSTWATTPYAGYNIFDPVANAEAAAWMWANGRRGEWVCQ